MDLAVDGQHIYLQTRSGSIRMIRKTDGRDVTAQVSDPDLGSRFRRPDAVAISGKMFIASVDPNGAWQGAKKGERIQIALRQEAGLTLAGVIRPHAQVGQLGVAVQWGGFVSGARLNTTG